MFSTIGFTNWNVNEKCLRIIGLSSISAKIFFLSLMLWIRESGYLGS